MAWTPGGHKARIAIETPYENVPEHLESPLWTWVEVVLNEEVDPTIVALRLRVTFPPGLRRHQQVWELKARRNDQEFLLDLVEELLDIMGPGKNQKILAYILDAANSAYAVRDDGRGLTMRITGGVQELVSEAVKGSAGSAGAHLANAWNSAYGRHHDAVKAYSEAIKAVESALAPHVTPQNGRQTLGTMIRDIQAKSSKWSFVISDGGPGGIETVLNMMKLLWGGQSSRHGGTSPTRDETLGEARAAVHLAAALVQFGSSGAFASA